MWCDRAESRTDFYASLVANEWPTARECQYKSAPTASRTVPSSLTGDDLDGTPSASALAAADRSPTRQILVNSRSARRDDTERTGGRGHMPTFNPGSCNARHAFKADNSVDYALYAKVLDFI